MPLNKDIKKVLMIGSGPIVIGQAAEFDYAGAQACRVLKAAGVNVVLVNSNPATIMTDKALADEIYLEPLTVDTVKRIIEKEKPDIIYACGPMPMLRGVKAYAEETGAKAYLSLEERMACGVGACLGCICKTKEIDEHSHVKNARICTDGPVFDADDLDM